MESTEFTTAIVTGGGTGIGRAIALQLAADGFAVAVSGRRMEPLEETVGLIEQQGGRAKAISADVTDLEQVQRLIAQTEDTFGPLELLVNNAGSLAAMGPTWETDPSDWWQDAEVNIRGVYNGCRAALPRMLERNAGRIINMTGGGATGPFPFVSAYAASKAAVVRFTENVTVELQNTDAAVKLFVMSPSFVRTEMTEQFAQTEQGRKWMDFMARRLEAQEDAPPEYAAELVARIASGDLDALHGRFLHAEHDRDQLRRLASEAEDEVSADWRVLRVPM